MAARPSPILTFLETSGVPVDGPASEVGEASAGVGEGAGRVAEGVARVPERGGGSRGAGTLAGGSMVVVICLHPKLGGRGARSGRSSLRVANDRLRVGHDRQSSPGARGFPNEEATGAALPPPCPGPDSNRSSYSYGARDLCPFSPRVRAAVRPGRDGIGQGACCIPRGRAIRLVAVACFCLADGRSPQVQVAVRPLWSSQGTADSFRAATTRCPSRRCRSHHAANPTS